MNIVHLQLTGNPGGIVSLCRDVANNSNNNNIIYFLFDGGTVADAIKEDGHQVEISYSSKRAWLDCARKLATFCKNNNVDVIVNHANCPIAIFVTAYAVQKNKKLKWVMYFHSAPEDLSFKKKVLYKPFVRYQFRHCNARIAISNFVKESATKVFKVNRNMIDVVYNGVDTTKFHVRQKKTSDKVRFIYVGRLIPVKGINVLLEAMCRLKASTNIQVVVVGGGTQQEELEKYARNNGLSDMVSFLGSRMDVPDLLLDADYFVHPAIWNEGFGITLIEAMSAGLPCIAFNRGAIPEIITDTVNGYIIDGVSVDKLAETIKKCADNGMTELYCSMVEEAKATAEKFSITNMVTKLETIIERC